METGVLQFKGESLQYRVSLHPTHQQSLHLKVSSALDTQNQWDSDDLQTIEKFFETKVSNYNFVSRMNKLGSVLPLIIYCSIRLFLLLLDVLHFKKVKSVIVLVSTTH